MENNTIKAHAVQIGMTDGINTEIISGINEGMTVITGIQEINLAPAGMPETQERSPFAPGPPGKKK